MNILSILLCAFVALNLVSLNEGTQGRNIKLAYLTKGAWKVCLQTDYGVAAPAKFPIDLGGFIHISDVESGRQFCNDLHLTPQIDDVMIIIPDRIGSQCYHYSECRGTIILKNEKVNHGNSKCYDILVGHYWHEQGLDSIKEFKISSIRPHGLSCDYNFLDSIIRSNLTKKVSDIFSPVEDLINNAIAQVTTLGNQFTAQITQQFTAMQNAVVDQVNQITLVVQQESNDITKTMTENYRVVVVKLETIEEAVVEDAGTVQKFLHILVHVVEFLGTIWLISLVYKLYKKAAGIFNIFSWIWARIRPAHPHHNPHPPQQQLQLQPRN